MLKSQRRHGRSFLVILVSVASLRAGLSAAPSGQGTAGDTAMIPFTIRVTPDALRDLSSRLALTRLPDELAGAAWDYGMNLGFFKDLLAYWQKQFDWRTQERRLNQQFSQYMTRIDGLRIHFVHQRSLVPAARPLLLLNGWPSSMDEFSRVIGPLTDPVRYGGRAEDAFHVVIPSMPGYGFSDKVRDRGYGNQQIASLWSELMARLGYDRYGVVGSDIGIGVGTQLALMNASHITGLHLAGCGAAPTPAAASDTQGYFELQATKPQTIGVSLSDSPAGLAAWIVEKYHGWSDHRGNVEDVYTKDQLLTTVMLYWLTNSGASSATVYYERRHPAGELSGRVAVPTACTNFDVRYDQRPRGANGPAVEQRYNVVRWTDMERGGHFAAFEQPQLWLDDVRSFFRNLP